MVKPFALPSPNFNKSTHDACKPKPHYLTPSGMSLLPREKQPPPMYGKHGPTLPARYLVPQVVKDNQSPNPLINFEKQYCEACELDLQSSEDLKRHRAQHEKCPVAGCLYKGHPSVMDKHVNALHASGLFDKFRKLSSPEEIAAWREERRKRYPTLANVLLKQKAKEQKQKRGERLETNKSRFGKVNDRKRAQSNPQEDKGHTDEKILRQENNPRYGNKKNKNKNKKSNKTELKPKVQSNVVKQKDDVVENEAESSYGIKMFRGTSQLANYKHFNEIKKSSSNVLFGLVGMYGSDDDSEDYGDDGHEEIIMIKATESNSGKSLIENCTEIAKTSNENIEIQSSIDDHGKKEDNVEEEIRNETSLSPADNNMLNTFLKDDVVDDIINEPYENVNSNQMNNSSDEGPEEMPIQRDIPDKPLKSDCNPKITFIEEPKCSKSVEKTTKSSKQKQIKKRKYGLDYRKARWRKQNTMLEKLLESDIRHERNVLLQCVRYVCENNFFNIGQNKHLDQLDKNKL